MEGRRIVIDDQRPLIVQLRHLPLQMRLWDRRRSARFDREKKRGALTLSPLTPYPPAHQLGQPGADRQAQACSAVFSSGARIDLRKRLEQRIDPAGGDAYPGILYGKLKLQGGFVSGGPGHGDTNFTRFREL